MSEKTGSSYDFFSYQLFEMAGGAHQENYEPEHLSATSCCGASNDSETKAWDGYNGLEFQSPGDGRLIVTADWETEKFYTYDDPSGTYYLVREKK